MKLSINDIEKKLKEKGYYATEALQYLVLSSLLYFSGNAKQTGHAIHTICLEGPAGCGKTFYAKTYAKVAQDIFNDDVVFIEYQCDPSTGKTELFEDIRISAVILSDADNAIIAGKLVQAIREVNLGKKVVLFLDEYDKAREETDAFLLQFLQDGQLNCNQYGDLKITDEYKKNLQVILCKNNYREELSEPLYRRLRIIRLDYMKPSLFYEIVKNKLGEIADNGLINLVASIYNVIYENRDSFMKLPSCSEMEDAIIDADALIKYGNAPKRVIYTAIVSAMFKIDDDLKIFEGLTLKNKELATLLKDMKENNNIIAEGDFNQLIGRTILQPILSSKIKEIDNRKNELAEKQIELDTQLLQIEELKKRLEQAMSMVPTENSVSTFLKMGDVKLELISDAEDRINNFPEEELIKRGKSVFSVSNLDFVKVAGLTNISYGEQFNNQLVIQAEQDKLVVYENGILLFSNPKIKLILSRKQLEGNQQEVEFFCDSIILPINMVNRIVNYLNTCDIYKKGSFNLNCLVYIENPTPNIMKLLTPIKTLENVYLFQISSKMPITLPQDILSDENQNIESSVNSSQKLKKLLKKE